MTPAPVSERRRQSATRLWLRFATAVIQIAVVCIDTTEASAHAIGGRDAAFVSSADGPDPVPFAYLGAKHMVTGYDHLLFLLGVIFYLRRIRDVALYATLFSLGHSITLLAGVALNLKVDAYLVDALIGMSVVYKAFDNLGGFKILSGRQPDNRVVVFGFGLVHGFGLATKLQALGLKQNGLLANLFSFNAGVEIGQILALAMLVGMLASIRDTRFFSRAALLVNFVLMFLGFMLTGYQLAGYSFSRGTG